MYQYGYHKPIYSPVAYELFLWAIEDFEDYREGLKIFKLYLKYEKLYRRTHRKKEWVVLNLVK